MASVDASGNICGAIICAICSSSFGNDDGIFRCSRHSTGANVAHVSTSSRSARGKGTQVTPRNISAPSCVIEKVGKDKSGQRISHLNRLIEHADWKDSNNFIVEDGVLKMFLGMDASLFNVDMLRKICSKIGFTSRKFTKAVCHETIIKAVSDGKLYDSVDPTSSSTVNDSTGLRCRLLNVLMSDAFVTRLQLLGSRKEMAEIDKGGAGQDRTFWEDVLVEFNDYSNSDYGGLVLTSSTDKKIFAEKNVNPSMMCGKNMSWENIRRMFLNVQKDYKVKYARYKVSGNHSNSFHDFCHGRLDTYYLHFWLSLRDAQLLESIVEELPMDVAMESTEESLSSRSVTGRQKKRKSTADILERHLQMKAEAKGGTDVLKSQKAAAYQLKSYCLGMNQLMDLSGKSTDTLNEEQTILIKRMKSTIGMAVGAMESHIKSGSIWCPTNTNTLDSTPKVANGSGNSNRSRQPNMTSSVARKLLSSEEKEQLSVSPISGDDLVEGASFATAEEDSVND
jgi:hypothetical protein